METYYLMPYMVTYNQIITLKNNKITNPRRVFVVANTASEAVKLVENFLKFNSEDSTDIISYENFIVTLCNNGDMLLDNGTYVNKKDI